MDCLRCASIMVRHPRDALKYVSAPLEVNWWCCILCGERLAPVITANRQSQSPPITNCT
jgi:hypothetical protein